MRRPVTDSADGARPATAKRVKSAPTARRGPRTTGKADAAAATDPAAPRQTYHHGNLRAALVEAAVAILEEQGAEKLTVREAAKRAGVSPGAPFRHFASRDALLGEVAVQAVERLVASVGEALAASAGKPPLRRLAAMGRGYLDWATTYPTHFRVGSDRRFQAYDTSVFIQSTNAALRQRMHELIAEAFGPRLGEAERGRIVVASRGLIYGLARMASDGHFPEWQLPGQSLQETLYGALDDHVRALEARAQASLNAPAAPPATAKRARRRPSPG